MDSVELKKICSSDPFIKKCFSGVFSSNTLPRKKLTRLPAALVCNTKPSNHPGEHWIALYLTESHLEYFCSFGSNPPSFVTRFAHRQGFSSARRTNVIIQSLNSTTCGQHCVLFLHFRCRGVPMRRIISLFDENRKKNDEIVVAMIKGLYKKDTVLRDPSFFHK